MGPSAPAIFLPRCRSSCAVPRPTWSTMLRPRPSVMSVLSLARRSPSPSMMWLYAAGSPMDNDAFPLSSLECESIDVNVPLMGGKVHGSLSRAGKVKGQTPKVEKKEKKKDKTGRAKRRMQYNRRFVNVVATFGKKRGPNSNS